MTTSEVEPAHYEPRISYRAWLWLQVQGHTAYTPLAQLILSGGPDGIWPPIKPLKPVEILVELQNLLAGGRPGITTELIDLARESVDDWLDDRPSVRWLIEDLESRRTSRDLRDVTRPRDVARAMTDEIRDVGDDILLTATRPAGAIRAGEGGLLRVQCDHTHATHKLNGQAGKGRRCRRYAVLGGIYCDLHGGQYLDPAEMREIIRRGSERLVAASDTAIDVALDIAQYGVNEAVRLKAAEIILDRAGFRPGMDVNITGQADTAQRDPAEVILERLAKIASHREQETEQPKQIAAVTDQPELPLDGEDHEIVEAVLVD